MKKQVLFIALTVAIVGFSAFTEKEVFTVNTSESKVAWLGKKVTGQHNGTVQISDGTLEIVNGKLKGGSFTIDMKSIIVLDLQDAEYNQKLKGHLKSDDFFGVEKHPKSTLVIKSVKEKSNNKYDVKGDITIKGITKTVEFSAEVNLIDSKAVASASITIDRSQFGVKYGSGAFFDNLGDKMIYDDFVLDITLVANN